MGGEKFGPHVYVYTRSGEYRYWTGSNAPWLKVNAGGTIFSASVNQFFTRGQVYEQPPKQPREFNQNVLTEDWPATGFEFDPVSEELYEAVATREEEGKVIHGSRVDHYPSSCDGAVAICEPLDSFGAGHLATGITESETANLRTGVAVNSETGAVLVANPQQNAIEVFEDVRPKATTKAATGATKPASP